MSLFIEGHFFFIPKVTFKYMFDCIRRLLRCPFLLLESVILPLSWVYARILSIFLYCLAYVWKVKAECKVTWHDPHSYVTWPTYRKWCHWVLVYHKNRSNKRQNKIWQRTTKMFHRFDIVAICGGTHYSDVPYWYTAYTNKAMHNVGYWYIYCVQRHLPWCGIQ
jgi:hypothetical protein